MGCPAGFVLGAGLVCTSCNNRLGHLDRAVVDEFDFMLVMAGIPRKKGRGPEIRSRGNVVATSNPPEISFNMGRSPTTAHDGTVLGAMGNSPRNIQAEFVVDGETATITFDVELGRNPKFVRGIHKIALESVAFFLGAQVALQSEFDPERRFVLNGVGQRGTLLKASNDTSFRNQVWAPYARPDALAVCFRLACVEFLVDLSAAQHATHEFLHKSEEIYGTQGWTYLPIDA